MANSKDKLERLCNIGAAEFLMPREKFTKLYEEKGFNVELIPFSASYFESSAIATTIQLAQDCPAFVYYRNLRIWVNPK